MSVEVSERGPKKREFMSSALALSGMTVAASFVEPSKVRGGRKERLQYRGNSR